MPVRNTYRGNTQHNNNNTRLTTILRIAVPVRSPTPTIRHVHVAYSILTTWHYTHKRKHKQHRQDGALYIIHNGGPGPCPYGQWQAAACHLPFISTSVPAFHLLSSLLSLGSPAAHAHTHWTAESLTPLPACVFGFYHGILSLRLSILFISLTLHFLPPLLFSGFAFLISGSLCCLFRLPASPDPCSPYASGPLSRIPLSSSW